MTSSLFCMTGTLSRARSAQPGHSRVWTVLLLAFLVAGSLAVGGCAAVRAYEREMLSDPIMERQDYFAKQTLEQKFFSTREGSIGGVAGIGGGCGCTK